MGRRTALPLAVLCLASALCGLAVESSWMQARSDDTAAAAVGECPAPFPLAPPSLPPAPLALPTGQPFLPCPRLPLARRLNGGSLHGASGGAAR